MDEKVRLEIEKLVERFLELVGEDVNREGLKATPHRVAKLYANFLTYGKELRVVKEDDYDNKEKKDEWYITIFENKEKYDQIIFRKSEFISMCEHHLVPFFGEVYIAYIPNKKIIGLNKLDVVVNYFAHRFQIQERLTKQICDFLDSVLEPKGVMVVIKARHMCAEITKNNGEFITSAVKGVFFDNSVKEEAMRLMGVINSGK